MTAVYASINEPIALGQQGDNQTTQVYFDVTDWIANHPDGTFVLQHQRKSDPVPYAIKYTRLVDSTNSHEYVVWTVTFHDTEQPLRYGKAELRYYVGRSLKKNAVYQTAVTPDPTGTGIPYPVPPGMLWVDSLALLTKDAQQARDEAVTAASDAETAKTAAEAASTLAESYATQAEGAVEQAEAAAESAKEFAESSKDFALESADHATDAYQSAKAAQDALQAMTFVTFASDPRTGHIFIQNGDLLGTTEFHFEPATTAIVSAGHLYVNY